MYAKLVIRVNDNNRHMSDFPAPSDDRRVTALVADDDGSARRQLVRALAAVWPGLHIVQAVDGVEAWDAFLAEEPSVCFLDVRMPGLTGIEVAQRVAEQAQTVFVMAPSDRALASFQAESALYLTKPLDAAQLATVVAQLQGALPSSQQPSLPSLHQLLDRLASQLRRPAPLEVIETGDGSQSRWIKVDDVVYFEADARCTRVVSQDGEVTVRTPLKALAAQLDPQRFQQINRFQVVNQRHILGARQVDADTMVLSLREQTRTLPVGRHFQALFRAH